MAAVLNRLGFRLRKGVKATPHKKMPETDAIVDHSKKKIPQQRYRSTSNAWALVQFDGNGFAF
jgi:hypothetical protein